MSDWHAIPGKQGYPVETLRLRDGWELYAVGHFNSMLVPVWPVAHRRDTMKTGRLDYRSPFWPLCSVQDIFVLAWARAQREDPTADVLPVWVYHVPAVLAQTPAELEAELVLHTLALANRPGWVVGTDLGQGQSVSVLAIHRGVTP